MSSLSFDETHFPLVVLTCAAHMDERAISALDTGFEMLFTRRSRFALVCDLRPVANIPDALTRKRLAELMNRESFRERQTRYQVAASNVLTSAPLRSALTALFWLWSPPCPTTTAATMEEAFPWAAEQLRAVGIAVAPDLVDRALAARVRRSTG